MLFYYSQWVYLLFLVPFLVWGIYYAWKNDLKRKKLLISEVVSNKLGLNISFLNSIQLVFRLLIIIFVILSLARPLGKLIDTDSYDSGREIVIALDISASMRAEDIPYPENSDYIGLNKESRFSASKRVLFSLLEKLENDKVSVVIFSDDAIPITPLTKDYSMVKDFLEGVSPSDYSGGTDLAQALEVSLKRFYKDTISGNKAIIIFSDGESHNQDITKVLEQLKKINIPILSVGVGTKEGSKIPEGRDLNNKPRFKTYLGDEIITRLEDELLKDISSQTKGKYFGINDSSIEDFLYNELSKLDEVDVLTSDKKRQELFQLPLVLALFFGFLELAIAWLTRLVRKRLK